MTVRDEYIENKTPELTIHNGKIQYREHEMSAGPGP